MEISNVIDIPMSVDDHSIKGVYIKNYMIDLAADSSRCLQVKRDIIDPIFDHSGKLNLPGFVLIPNEVIREFVNKYCYGPKAIKDDIYYFINAKRNNYEFLTVQRDLEKSPRKETKVKVHQYKATYDHIEKDPEMIANYYSKKYSISDKDNIVAMMTEDDVLCLNCGCISDQRLSDVPDLKTHINNMVCPKCNSTTSTLVTFNKYLHKTSMHCRDAQM